MDTIKINKGNALMVAHRGVSKLEKENSMPAFVAAGNRSYFGVETDVHRTADGKYVVIHDGNTGRVAPLDIEIEKSTYDTIRGVMVIEGIDYAISGERETERERGESESETEFRVTLGEDRYMYVEQSEEREGEETEQEYTYSLREGGSLVERSTFSYETERGETELKMTSYKGGQSKIFYFEKENYRGEDVVFIRVGNNQSAQGYIVETVTDENGTRYEYIPVNGR